MRDPEPFKPHQVMYLQKMRLWRSELATLGELPPDDSGDEVPQSADTTTDETR